MDNAQLLKGVLEGCMQIKFEDGIITFIDNDKENSFDSHGNYLNSFIKYDLIDREKHRLRENHDGETGKISKVEDVAIGNNRAAWYVQDYLPDGENYKRSKKAIITLGDFVSGEERVIYKGECFGDLCFDGDDLYFNIGNKVAVYHLSTDVFEILFKHSGIKKDGLELHITPKRIFYQHWSHSSNNTMWYDRETKETVNPRFDGRPLFFLNDELIIYGGVEHTWKYDVLTRKKKRLFSNKTMDSIFKMVAAFFGVPDEYCDRYHSMFASVELQDYKDGRLFFKSNCSYNHEGMSSEEKLRECHNIDLPMSLHTIISSNASGEDIRIEVEPKDIIRKEKPYTTHYKSLDFMDVSLWTYQNN